MKRGKRALETITLTIDGEKVSCSSGCSVLDAAHQHGIRIPSLCHHPDLRPFGACRLCLVEDQDSGRLFASCVTPAGDGMNVRTDSPRILEHRRNIVRLMMAEHPESCIVCGKGNRCQLRQLAAQLGVGETHLYAMPNYKPLEQANPFLLRDLTKCILCGKCIRADHELVVEGAIDYNRRGFRSRPATLYDLPLEHSNCTFCGTCVSICPTGALSPQTFSYVGTPQGESISTCGFCAVGCSLSLGMAYDRIVEANPSHRSDTVNGSTLCVRGHFAHDFLNAKDRLTRPMIRKDGEWIPVGWEEAVRHVGRQLKEIRHRIGPQGIGFLGSSKCTNEENYIFQQMARALLGTNNVDNGGYAAGRPVWAGLERQIPWPRVLPLKELEESEVIVVWGGDPAHSAPVVGYHVKRATRKGIPMIVVNPRKTTLVPFSTLWLRLEPGSDLALIGGLANVILSRKTPGTVSQPGGLDKYRDDLMGLKPAKLSADTGVPWEDVEQMADLLLGKKIAMVVGTGITLQPRGRQSLEALALLAQEAGEGSGREPSFYALERENNSAGAWDMGAVPDALPGRVPLTDAPTRSQWERFWQTRISPDQGLSVPRMVEEIERGSLRALYVMGENPVRSLPQPERVSRALEGLDLLIVQDILHTETCQWAHVILPGAAFCEKAGSFTNLEGRIQKFERAVPPPGQAKPDWEILDMISLELGAGRRYGSLQRIRDEIAQRVPAYEKLAHRDGFVWLQKPVGSSVLQEEIRSEGRPFSDPYGGEEAASDRDFPFQAMIGSHRLHLGSGTRTGRSERIDRWRGPGAVEIHPEDAGRLHLEDGDRVQVASREGTLERDIRLGEGMGPGWIYVPMGFDGNSAMNLIGLTPLGSDPYAGWKSCRVNLKKMEA
jgi:formate dehydrogenase alpha subunit